jgi:sirohydrochlorin ferrochelatase
VSDPAGRRAPAGSVDPAGATVPAGPGLVLLAHGTGDAAGRGTWGRLLLRLRARLPGVDVRLAYAGVARPSLADVLPATPSQGRGVVVVPCFLAAGFHVRVDVPGQLAAIGRDDVVLAEPLGPDPALLDVALERLQEAGGSPAEDVLVLAAAGSTDAVAQEDLRTASALLEARVGRPVPVGYIAGGEPRVAAVVGEQRGRVALVTWLLAPGAFHRWLGAAGAAVVAEPLGDHPGVVDVVVERYRAALPTGVRP